MSEATKVSPSATPTTMGGTDPNDPAEKALALARQRAREERNRPADVVMVEVLQAQLRANPELATAWKTAPGGNV